MDNINNIAMDEIQRFAFGDCPKVDIWEGMSNR